MFMIEQIPLGGAELTACSVPETDYPVWSSATAYAIGTRVILTTGVHKVFEAVAANTNKSPAVEANIGTYWVVVGATNRWKIFDKKISDPVQFSGSSSLDNVN